VFGGAVDVAVEVEIVVRRVLCNNAPLFLFGYDTRCYFKVRSKADTSQLNLTHGTNK